jgi:hypothetical protein
MRYRIESIQTIFGEERKRRLKLAFDVIWNLDIQKAGAEGASSTSQNSYIPTVAKPTSEEDEESKEDTNQLPDTKRKR